MATRMQQRRGTAAQWISTNAGAGPVLNAGEIGWESDTNKFKIGDGVNNWSTLDYFIDGNSTANPAFGSSITFEGATANDFETTVAVTDPTADRTITLPDATGTVVLADGSGNITVSGNLTVSGTTTTINSTTINATTGIVFEGATANDFETTLTVTDPTADRTVTFQDATGTVVLRDSTDTLTNKSISLGSNTVTSTLAQLNTAVSDADVASLAGTETLTNKTVALGSNTVSGTLAQFNTAVTDADFASLAGTETLTNKTLTTPVISSITNGAATLTLPSSTGTIALTTDIPSGVVTESGTQTLTNKTLTSPTVSGLTLSDSSIVIEGSSANDFETTLSVTNPTEDRTITFPDATGTVALVENLTTSLGGTYVLTEDIGAIDGVAATDGSKNVITALSVVFEGATANDFETLLTVTEPASDITLSLPNSTDTLVGRATTDTLTNKTLSGGLASADPTTALGIATKQYVDAVVGNTNYHAPVAAASNTNFVATYNNGTSGVGATLTFTSTGAINIDGVAATIGIRILVKNQTTDTQNGVYTVTTAGTAGVSCVLTRATDADNNPDGEMANGDVVFCTGGTINSGKTFINASTNPIIIGTSAITYSEYSTALPSQTGNSGKYLTTDGTTPSWGTVAGYSAPTLGSTSIASGATVTTITGLTLSGATLTGTLTAGGGVGTSGQVLSSTGSGTQWIAASSPTLNTVFAMV